MTWSGRVMCCKWAGIWCIWARTIVCCSGWLVVATTCCITSGLKLLTGCTVFREMLVITDTSEDGQSVVSVKHCSRVVEGVVLAAPEARGLGLLWSLLAVRLRDALRELRLLRLNLERRQVFFKANTRVSLLWGKWDCAKVLFFREGQMVNGQFPLLFQDVGFVYLGSGHSHDDPESSGSSSQELAEAMPEEAETRSWLSHSWWAGWLARSRAPSNR